MFCSFFIVNLYTFSTSQVRLTILQILSHVGLGGIVSERTLGRIRAQVRDMQTVGRVRTTLRGHEM